MSKLEQSSTWKEIQAQPEIWRQWALDFAPQIAELQSWVRAHNPSEILFVGAGTSAYIGEILAAERDGRFFAYPSTSIVADPASFFRKVKRPLIVQFGRSGNSSESIGVLDILDAHAPSAPRLHITCNADSVLAKRTSIGAGETKAIILPAATHDAGFAMTSSFSTMLLTAQAIFGGAHWGEKLDHIAQEGDKLWHSLSQTMPPRPARAIFLGTGALEWAAREMALKVLELTAGAIMTSAETVLGFRHGPKAAIVDDTHVFVLTHPDPYTHRYDQDLTSEIRTQFPNAQVTTIGAGGDIAFQSTGDASYDAILHVMTMQIRACQWAAALDLHIDDPFIDHGNLSRVVSGVRLYPY